MSEVLGQNGFLTHPLHRVHQRHELWDVHVFFSVHLHEICEIIERFWICANYRGENVISSRVPAE